ncbi:MAG: PQQ-binding-like beta-propeller repeat protein [Thermoguttaceae bacterium]|jgi:outer membrane protein assembly factor BamB
MNDNATKKEIAYRIAARTAAVAAVFSVIVAALLLYDFSRRTTKDPSEAPALGALRVALDKQPGDEDLLAAYRDLDQQLRAEHFRQVAFAATGASLLGLGLLVMLAAAKTAATLRRKLPAPQPLATPQDLESRWKPWAIAGVAVVAALLAGLDVALSAWRPAWLPSDVELASLAGPNPPTRAPREAWSGGLSPLPHPPAYVATDDEIRTAWPRFRGPDGSGICPYSDVPDTWDVPANKNVVWKTAVPLPGSGSAIVCGQRVFLTGASETTRQVFAFDAKTGALVWRKDVPSTPASRQPVKLTGADFASSTPATDGRRVFAIFANGDLAAFDYSGELLWKQSPGIPESPYGHAASLLVYKDMLLVPLDQGTLEQVKAGTGRSKLLALEAATGNPVWQKGRPVAASWTTPIVIRHADRQQIITASAPWVIAYDPKDGSELWRAGKFEGDVAPSPVFAGGVLLVAANDHSPMLAIRPDGKGDVTRTHVLWKGEDNIPDLCSPVATETCVYLLDPNGMLTAYDTHTGNKLWEEDLGHFTAKSSPSLVCKLLYVIGEDGKGLIFEPLKDHPKKVGVTDLGEPCVTSPAFQSGRIYLRGKKHLFCIGK